MSKKIEVLPLEHTQDRQTPSMQDHQASSLRDRQRPSMQDRSLAMDKLTRHFIDQNPWPGYPPEPRTSFSIAHISDAILLKFYVAEQTPRVTFHKANDPVYKDSCVEFFISFDPGSGYYYNLECNAIGTCLLGYGNGRAERSSLPATLIQSIDYYSSVEASSWSLTLKIPVEVFVHDKITHLSGTSARANFYKCGDECPSPHYLAWNNIKTPGPDFHQPGFFGELSFV